LLAKPYPSPERIDILRIVEAEGEFDIALRASPEEYGGVSQVVLGPILVLGTGFPTTFSAVPSGVRIRLRPKVSSVPGKVVTAVAVERVIAWCLSKHFRAVQCDRYGLPSSAKA
jgi:hypothetical protein